MKNTNQIYEAPCMRVQQAMAQTMLCASNNADGSVNFGKNDVETQSGWEF